MYELTALVSAELFIHFNFPFEQAMAETNMEMLFGDCVKFYADSMQEAVLEEQKPFIDFELFQYLHEIVKSESLSKVQRIKLGHFFIVLINMK